MVQDIITVTKEGVLTILTSLSPTNCIMLRLACKKNNEIEKTAHVWGLADNKDMDQRAHSHTMIWTFVVCYNK